MSEMSLVRTQGVAEWEIEEDEESGLWVGVCVGLGLNADGGTFSELQECMLEVTEDLFTDLVETGDLVPFLRERGLECSEEVVEVRSGVPLRVDLPYAKTIVRAASA